MLAKTNACALDGVRGFLVEVETFISNGLVSFEIVGLPSAAVKESRDRVRAALAVSGYRFPFGRVTVNLAPADIRKEGTAFDLAIAISLLAADDPERFHHLEDTVLLGELSLQGKLMPIRGALGMAITAAEQGKKFLILPSQNARECECIDNIQILPANTLQDVCKHLTEESPLTEQPHTSYQQLLASAACINDMKYVKGQPIARKALEIAAAGGHNLLMVGIPGSGKTMLARCLPGILPPLSYEEALETTLIHSASGELGTDHGLMTVRPFRSPHHNTSLPAMIGGGNRIRPGEVSLAHNGVLFLDELPEFQRATLEGLRQPLEDGFVNITRVSGQNRYQSNCMLVAGMNPCPCGNLGSRIKECTCSPYEIKRYLARISGPLLDRIDLHIEVPAVNYEDLENKAKAESSAEIKKRVDKAREIQLKRYNGTGICANSDLDASMMDEVCALDSEGKELLKNAFELLGLSARAHNRILKVARTIADLEGSEKIQKQNIAEAIRYRSLDRKFWA